MLGNHSLLVRFYWPTVNIHELWALITHWPTLVVHEPPLAMVRAQTIKCDFVRECQTNGVWYNIAHVHVDVLACTFKSNFHYNKISKITVVFDNEIQYSRSEIELIHKCVINNYIKLFFYCFRFSLIANLFQLHCYLGGSGVFICHSLTYWIMKYII